MEPIVTALVNFGGFGILSAALFYIWNKTFEAHKDEQAKDRELFKSEVTENRRLYKEDVQAERLMCHEDHSRIMATLVECHAKQMDVLEKFIRDGE